VVVIEGFKGNGFLPFSIGWFKKSMRRRFPHVQVLRVEHNFPSTRMCNACGKIGPKLTVERVFVCECGHTDDRDLNAAKNLRDWKTRTSSWEV
ncbi:zinc ribbon domain-containing protein, partial [Streptomyces sp. P17]|uniref:zinc ribbon domain-containing protein n=1 Tax=Streptomyces sp. P17 TaxID=3074716 RepID=UPI0028F40198